MDALLKILKAEEKKIDLLTARYKVLKKNIANETNEDTMSRTLLSAEIAVIKKSNAVIVDHCLGEHKLALPEIEKIIKAHPVQ
jgi:hypothetical protein